MTTQELLKEVLKDSLFQDKYHIPQSELQEVSFDTTSPYPIVETIKTIIQFKGNGTPDVNVFKNIKQNNFNITD